MRSLVLALFLFAYLPVAAWAPFCGALLWTWISIMNPHREVYGFAASLPVGLMVAIVTIGGWLFSREPKRLAGNAVTLSFVLLLPLSFLTTVLSLAPSLAWSKFDLVYKSLIMAIIVLSLMNSKVRIHAIVWVLCLSLGYFGAKGGVFTITSGGESKVFGPPYTYITDNNHLALALIMVAPLINYLRMHTANSIVKLGLMVTMCLSLLAAIFTYSRGGLLGLAAMGLILWWRSRKKLLVTVLFVLGAFGVVSFAPQALKDRMSTIRTYDEDASAMSRIEIWMSGLRIVQDRFLVGGGLRVTQSQEVINSYTPGVEARAVHNSHLEILIEQGIFGFLIHLCLIISVVVYTTRIMRRTKNVAEFAWAYDLAAMLQASLVAYLVGGSFLSLAYYDGWWYLPMIAAATYRIVMQTVPHRGFLAPGARPQLSPEGAA